MTIRVAMLIFVVSFAAITGWLVTRTPAEQDLAYSPPKPDRPADNKAPQKNEPENKASEPLVISDEERGLKKALNSIIIPVIDLDAVPLEEALAMLNLKLRETESRQISNLDFIIRKQSASADYNPDLSSPATRKVSLRAENISMATAIDRICQQTGHDWSIEGLSVVLNPLQ